MRSLSLVAFGQLGRSAAARMISVLAASLALVGCAHVGPAPSLAPTKTPTTPCSDLHPAQFTHVLIRLERDYLTPAPFTPQKIENGRCVELDGYTDSGRFSISERGEIVLRFDSAVPGVGAGSLLVSGKILADGQGREIEIPGYRVLGKSETPQRVTDAIQKAAIKAAIDKVVECAGTGCEPNAVRPLSELKVDDASMLKPFISAAGPAKSTETEVAVLKVLREVAKIAVDKLPTTWSDVRIQPKELGAHEGEVIEITIKHSVAGQTVEPTWTLRFVVEKTGVYVHVSPVLSLIWSHRFSPEDDFRGAQGLLAPGVEFTIDWFAGRYGGGAARVLGFIFSGIGLGIDYLDFDSRQAVELGVKADIQLFRGIISLGVGYNLGPQDPRFSDRAFYYSIGIGIDKVLDRAARVANFFAQ